MAVASQSTPAQTGTPTEVTSGSVAVTSIPAAPAPLPGVAAPSAPTADEAKNSTGGNVAELQQLIHGTDLTELRTSYNGSYGASLLFRGNELTYYVALFQQKNFWRVVKTADVTRAEAIYADFVRQTVQLSDVEIRRARLEAQKAFTDRMIAQSQDRAARLQADLSVAQAQQAEVANRQKQTRAQAEALDAESAAAQSQLRELQQRVRDLQRQADAGLPTLKRR
jgi:Protein of unknown function (DUF2968)